MQNLAYYNYRYYSPELGRWLSRDPIEEKGGVNLYLFARNDAINNWDRLGQISLARWLDVDNYTDGLEGFYDWLYTGKIYATDEEWEAAMVGAADGVNCYLKCLLCMK